MTTDTSLDPAAAVLAQVKDDHHQHVCSNHPEPGICVSRCPGRPWPCAPYRAAQAVEAALRAAGEMAAEAARFDGIADSADSDSMTRIGALSASQAYDRCARGFREAIVAALTGTTAVGLAARELAEHNLTCVPCHARTYLEQADAPGELPEVARCTRGRVLADRWRRAVAEEGLTR